MADEAMDLLDEARHLLGEGSAMLVSLHNGRVGNVSGVSFPGLNHAEDAHKCDCDLSEISRRMQEFNRKIKAHLDAN